ncbi:hypothetical protein AAY473_040344 [Plecturocebus cupreus]
MGRVFSPVCTAWQMAVPFWVSVVFLPSCSVSQKERTICRMLEAVACGTTAHFNALGGRDGGCRVPGICSVPGEERAICRILQCGACGTTAHLNALGGSDGGCRVSGRWQLQVSARQWLVLDGSRIPYCVSRSPSSSATPRVSVGALGTVRPLVWGSGPVPTLILFIFDPVPFWASVVCPASCSVPGEERAICRMLEAGTCGATAHLNELGVSDGGCRVWGR